MRQHVANYGGVKLDGATCRQQRKSCRLTCQQRWSLRSSFGVRHRPYLAREIWERHAHSENESDGFRPHYAHEIIKRQVCRSSWIFQFEKNWSREIIWLWWSYRFQKSCVFNLFSAQNVKSAFSNSFGLNSVFEKLRFLDGLVWTVGLNLEIKLGLKFLRRGLIFGQGLQPDCLSMIMVSIAFLLSCY